MEEISMLRLNDDCLSNIFERLELRDQLWLTAVCGRFREIIVSVQWRSRFRRFETLGNYEIDALSPGEYRSLFKLIVHRIEHLVIIKKTYRRVYPWRPDPTFYLRCKFPTLRVLECKNSLLSEEVSEGDLGLIVKHCPLIEELYLPKYISSKVWPHFVRMRHLHVLHLPRIILNACELQQILTLPLNKLWIEGFLKADDSRLLAETVIGANDLQVLRIGFVDNTPGTMKWMIALASTSKRRYPLAVKVVFHHKSSLNEFQIFESSLQPLIDNKLTGPTRVLVEWNIIEFRFFCESNEK